MMQWTLITLTLIISLTFMSMKHPLAMGLTLLIQTALISMLTGLMAKSFWFSFILFLVFLGGMLVLFIYVTSLASNEMFSMSLKLSISMLIIFLFMMMLLSIMDMNFLFLYKNLENTQITNMTSYITEISLSLSNLYNYPSNLMTILLINYLLLTLIAVVKITKMFKGPLRPMFN